MSNEFQKFVVDPDTIEPRQFSEAPPPPPPVVVNKGAGWLYANVTD